MGYGRAGTRPPIFEFTASVTAGTLSNPLVGDDNGGKQIAGRAAIRPVTGLRLVPQRTARSPRRGGERCARGADANAYTQTAGR